MKKMRNIQMVLYCTSEIIKIYIFFYNWQKWEYFVSSANAHTSQNDRTTLKTLCKLANYI